jgi:mRNA-degrading endonuclease RelE of RelBE toxin-antitoxin system
MWSVRLAAAALESLQTVPEEDRGEVLAAVGPLTQGPVPPGLPRPYRLKDRTDAWVLRAGRYRIAYAASCEDEPITVIDIVGYNPAPEFPSLPAAT